MKRNLTIVLSALFIFIAFQMSSVRLQSNSLQPVVGGLSGDPGQTTCVHCHSDITNGIVKNSQFILKISPDSAGLVGTAHVIDSTTQYYPNSTQWISIEVLGQNTNGISSGFTPKQGFQFTALNAASDSMAGSFTLVDPKTAQQTSANAYQTAAAGLVTYVSHHAADSATHIWYFKWNAPGSGNVTFYYTGNLGNGDGTYNGDTIFIGKTTLSAGPVGVGIQEVPSNISDANAYPVPFSHQLSAELHLDQASPLSITLVSMEGITVKELYSGEAAQGRFSRSFDLEGVAAGVYLLRIQSGSSTQVIKALKL